MNNVSRFPGTTLRADLTEQAIEDAEDEATDAFDCAIGQVRACMKKLRVQQGGATDPAKCFESALDYLTNAISDLEYGKARAAEAAAVSVKVSLS